MKYICNWNRTHDKQIEFEAPDNKSEQRNPTLLQFHGICPVCAAVANREIAARREPA